MVACDFCELGCETNPGPGCFFRGMAGENLCQGVVAGRGQRPAEALGDGWVKHNAPSHTPAATVDTGNRMSPKPVLLFEFRPQPAEAFRTGSGHPAEAGAKEGVFLFTLEL